MKVSIRRLGRMEPAYATHVSHQLITNNMLRVSITGEGRGKGEFAHDIMHDLMELISLRIFKISSQHRPPGTHVRDSLLPVVWEILA